MKHFFLFAALFVLSAQAKGPAPVSKQGDWILSQKGNEYTLDGKKTQTFFGSGDLSKILGPITFVLVPTVQGPVHVKLTGLKPGNVFSPLGLKVGDILKTLNGRGLTLDLFLKPNKPPAEWDRKKRYVLKIERAAKEETFVYLVK